MALQAFDKDGNKIPFAIIDGDFVVDDAVVAPVKRRLIQLSVANVNEHGVFLAAADYLTYDFLEFGITFDEAYAREDWTIVSNYWPVDRDIPAVAITDIRSIADTMRALHKQLTDAREERSNICGDMARYDALGADDAPIRVTERKIETMKMVLSVAMFAALGCWPKDMRDMGL